MRRGVKVAVLGLLIAVGLFVLAVIARVLLTHGHSYELLTISVRLVDRDSGRPLEPGTVIGTALGQSIVESEYFPREVDSLLELEEEDRWELGFICATRASDEPVTTLRSAAHVTTWWVGSVRVSKEVVKPHVLFVQLPHHGRVVVPIDPKLPLEQGDESDTWRLDLGTIRVP